VATEELERLLVVQEHDLACDRLRHRRATLPERAELDARRGEVTALDAELEILRQRLDAVRAEERRLDDQAQAVGAHATEADQKLYSGTVTSPRELQALQADFDMLQRRRRDLEDQELDVMEARETLEGEITAREQKRAQLLDDARALADALAAAEAEIDDEAAAETAARTEAANGITPTLLRDYERRRERNRGAGAARLVGATCQACHLSIPSTEAERIRRAAGATVAYCDNCGAILVP
jgi:predicted  nucleic acid-binding Zn-ribbon protein